VLLLMEKCPAHPPDTGFLINKKKWLCFLQSEPASCSPLILDWFIHLKQNTGTFLGWSQLLPNGLKAELELNILQAIHMVTAMWNSITCAIIRNCFRKAEFPDH
jgi:hypothetical protein